MLVMDHDITPRTGVLDRAMLRSLSWGQTHLEPPRRPPESLLLALESSEQGNSQALVKAAQLHAKPLPTP